MPPAGTTFEHLGDTTMLMCEHVHVEQYHKQYVLVEQYRPDPEKCLWPKLLANYLVALLHPSSAQDRRRVDYGWVSTTSGEAAALEDIASANQPRIDRQATELFFMIVGSH